MLQQLLLEDAKEGQAKPRLLRQLMWRLRPKRKPPKRLRCPRWQLLLLKLLLMVVVVLTVAKAGPRLRLLLRQSPRQQRPPRKPPKRQRR